jgi:hypothetical protein
VLLLDIPDGWTLSGEPTSVQLKRPCPACPYEGEVVAHPIVQGKKGRKLRAQCPSCHEKFDLSIKEYGSTVKWQPSRSGVRRRGPAWQPRDHQLFARFDWCCVYHEGSAEAALFRGQQIDQLRIATLASSVASPEQGSLFTSATDITRPTRIDPNLFGLVPDHVIPKVLQERLDEFWTPQHRELMAREWIVAACNRCNIQRNQELESVQKLLYIFSRFVLPHRPGDDIERLHETFLFVQVLEKIEAYRVANGGASEPLRPARLPRKADNETA